MDFVEVYLWADLDLKKRVLFGIKMILDFSFAQESLILDLLLNLSKI